MATLKVRNIAGFNRKVLDALAAGEGLTDPFWQPDLTGTPAEIPLLQPLPFIVVVIDELADMMMIVGKKVEELIARLAQKARAAGIPVSYTHLDVYKRQGQVSPVFCKGFSGK